MCSFIFNRRSKSLSAHFNDCCTENTQVLVTTLQESQKSALKHKRLYRSLDKLVPGIT